MENERRARIREDLWVSLLCAATDLLLVWVALNLATLTRMHTLPYTSLFMLQRDRIIILAAYLVCGQLAGAFQGVRLTDRFDSAYYAGAALALTAVFAFLSVAVLPRDFIAISRREIALGILVAVPLLGAWRAAATSLASRFAALYGTYYVLGDAAEGERVAKAIHENPQVPAEAHYLDDEERARAFPPGAPPAATPGHDAIICLGDTTSRAFHDLLDFCEAHCRQTFVYPSLYDTLLFQHSRLLAIGGVPLIEVPTREPASAYVRTKRLIDFCAALGGCLLALPLFIGAAIAVKSTSPGGMFYTQERMGKGGRTFNIIKFRTMVQDAESQTGPVWARKNDARVTPVGAFLRKHRIDEIPQLINVLKGDMSLVGPRPERPHFHEEFRRSLPLFDRRLLVRPGVTSLSHVLGSYGSDPADRLRYDLVYIGTLSLLNDLKIMLLTVRVVLGGKGAQ